VRRRGARPVKPAEVRRLKALPDTLPALDLLAKKVSFGGGLVGAYRLADGRVLIETRFFAVAYPSEADLIALWESSPEQRFTRPWQERRGNDAYDGNYLFSAVKGPPADVTARLAATRSGAVRDAIGRDVPAAPEWMFVVRIEGHSWTLVIGDGPKLGDDLDDLSAASGLMVFHLAISDTHESLDYRLLDGGVEVERFSSSNEDFHSSRGTKPPDPDDAHGFLDDVAVGLDLYIPDLSGEYFVGSKRPTRGTWPVRNPGRILVGLGNKRITTVPPFEAVDYIWYDDAALN
jgi:hypothetical protein